jgi:hypothetical protein
MLNLIIVVISIIVVVVLLAQYPDVVLFYKKHLLACLWFYLITIYPFWLIFPKSTVTDILRIIFAPIMFTLAAPIIQILLSVAKKYRNK